MDITLLLVPLVGLVLAGVLAFKIAESAFFEEPVGAKAVAFLLTAVCAFSALANLGLPQQ